MLFNLTLGLFIVSRHIFLPGLSNFCVFFSSFYHETFLSSLMGHRTARLTLAL